MKEKINISKEEAKKEIDDLTKEKEFKEKQLTFFEFLFLHLCLAPICKFKETFPNAWNIIVIITLLFFFYAVFFGGSRYIEY